MPERTFKQKRAASSFAAKLRKKGLFASVLEEPVKPWGATKRERAQKRYIVQYDSGRGIMGNPGTTVRGWVRARAVKIVRDKSGRATSVKIRT
jgi:hypothetical protein